MTEEGTSMVDKRCKVGLAGSRGSSHWGQAAIATGTGGRGGGTVRVGGGGGKNLIIKYLK